ncbi:hypothetical protein ACF0H5_024021 [Mactra antiquata]
MQDNYVCGKCGKVAKTKQALERHAAYHEDDRPFSCEICLQRFKNSDDRGKHYRRLKRDGKYNIACQVCHKHFKTVEILNKHVEMLGCKVKNESKDVPVSTDTDLHGNKSIKDKTSEQEVAESVSDENIPGTDLNCSCKICEEQFHGTHLLKAHYKIVHKDMKKQVCIKCGQTLSSKDSLARHFSIFHQSSFPYSCDVCNFKFKIKENLCKHLKFVHKDGGYPCKVCHRVFTQPVNLKKHLAVHSVQKNHICGVCGREFRWKQALQKHEALHGVKNEIGDFKACGSQAVDDTVSNEGDNISEFLGNKTDLLCEEYEMKLENVSQSEASEVVMEIERLGEHIENSEGCGKNVDIGNDLNKKTERLKARRCHDRILGKETRSGKDKNIENGGKEFNDRFEFIDDDFDNLNDEAGDIFDKLNKSDASSPSRKRFSNEKVECLSGDKRIKVTFDEAENAGIEGIKDFKGLDEDSKMKMMFEGPEELEIESKMESMGPDNVPVEFDSLTGRNDDHGRVKDREDRVQDDACFKERVDSNVVQIGETVVDRYNENRTENNKNPRDGSHSDTKEQSGADMTGEPNELGQSPRKSSDFRYSALTSFSHSEADDVSAFVFKPSSIQNILSKPINGMKNREDEKAEKVTSVKQRKPVKISMKFSNRISSLGQSLHNPFLIQDSRRSPTPASTPKSQSPRSLSCSDDTFNNESSESKSPTTIIPSGKFSMLKHMLTLQNEENFDKAVFENPLYNKLPEVKDLRNFVERRKITEQTDSCLVEKYDLSGKQNIPFHWLGMSTHRKKVQTNDCVENKKQNSDLVKTASGADNSSNALGKSVAVTNAERQNVPVYLENNELRQRTDNLVNVSHNSREINSDKSSSKICGFSANRSNTSLTVAKRQEKGITGFALNSRDFTATALDHSDKQHSSSVAKTSEVSLMDPNVSSPIRSWQNVLKVFDASSSTNLHNTTYEPLNVKQTWSGKSVSRERINSEFNTKCNRGVNYSCSSTMSSKFPIQSGIQTSSTISVDSDGSTDVHQASNTHSPSDVFNSPSHNFAQFSRSLSLPSNNRSNLSFCGTYNLTSENVHDKSNRVLFHSSSPRAETVHGSLDDTTCTTDTEKFGGMNKQFGINRTGNINQNDGQGCSDRGQGHTDISRSVSKNNHVRSWSLPRPTPQSHNNHYTTGNMNDIVEGRNLSLAQNISSASSQNSQYFMPYLSSEHRHLPCPSSQIKTAPLVTDIFTALDYSTKSLHLPSKNVASRDVNNISEVMALYNTSTNSNVTLDNADLNKHNVSQPSQGLVPSVIDYSFGGGKNDKGNAMRFHMLDKEMASKPGDNSGGKNDVSIFDILKGQTDKPRQLENVDYLLDAYV